MRKIGRLIIFPEESGVEKWKRIPKQLGPENITLINITDQKTSTHER
ncbi:MAG: hypothetical protein GY790_23575 [Bacteroidetes bacterium]|nr:hypothetical protein [Bacteroidota bacterium]